LSHDLSPFLLFVIFQVGFPVFAWSQSHTTWPPTQLVCWDGVSLTFCLGCPRTMILPISASQAAGITATHHHTWPRNHFFIPLSLSGQHSVWHITDDWQILFEWMASDSCIIQW
jgi:hypothetical protein